MSFQSYIGNSVEKPSELAFLSEKTRWPTMSKEEYKKSDNNADAEEVLSHQAPKTFKQEYYERTLAHTGALAVFCVDRIT